MNRMRELVDRLNETAYQYYTLDNPTISDAEWDRMYDELVALEQSHGRSPARFSHAARRRRPAAGL